ncbi:MAG: PAS domain S-box protein [Candidatus Tectomicrobia bacterium]|uniref:PAS domain S-box protein n=1 Tax=Tectimicrobiota bacterium TaxID=2528274 RepID=A0A937W3A3_UNCTE|nr:PAS domain S-box protein [Candidatus Tectomicrobia bacterium]
MLLEKITTTVGFAVVALFLNFTFVFLERPKDIPYGLIMAMIAAAAALNMTTNVYVAGFVRYHWGVSLQTGPLFIPMVLCVLVMPMLFALYLLYARLRCVTDPNTKKQLWLLIQGVGLFFVANVVCDFILPHLFHLKDLVRLGIPAGVLEAGFIFLAVRKYNFLSIRFEEISNALFRNLQDAIVLIDKDGRLVQINDSAKALMDFDQDNLRTVHLQQVFEHYDVHMQYKNHETVAHTRRGTRIVSLSQADVKQYKVEVGKILIVRDITESKEAQAALYAHQEQLEHLAGELAETNASLERKVLDRTMSLQQSNEQLQREMGERTRIEAALAAEKERLTVTLRSIADGVISTDTRGTTVLLNQVAEALTGWEQSQALGQPLDAIFDVLDEKTLQPCRHLVEEVLQSEAGGQQVRHMLLRTRGWERAHYCCAWSTHPGAGRAGAGDGLGLSGHDRHAENRRGAHEDR